MIDPNGILCPYCPERRRTQTDVRAHLIAVHEVSFVDASLLAGMSSATNRVVVDRRAAVPPAEPSPASGQDGLIGSAVTGYHGLVATVCRQTGNWHPSDCSAEHPVVTLYVAELEDVHRGVLVRVDAGVLAYVSGGPDVSTWRKEKVA